MPDPVTPNLGLDLPTLGEDPWYTQVNGNWTLIDTFAGTVVLYSPTASQKVTQPAATYLSVNALQLYGATPSLAFGVAAASFQAGLSMPTAGTLSVDTTAPGNSLGTLKVAVINAATGYQIAGAAASGHALVGNGTYYVDTPLTSLNYYQTVQAAAVSQTQRPRLNFLATFAVADNAGNTSTDVDLANTGVVAGSYSNPTFTVNQKGQITAATSGTGGLTLTSTVVTGSRAFGVVYQNGSAFPISELVTVRATTPGSSCNIQAQVGSASDSLVAIAQQSALQLSASDTYGGYGELNFEVAAGDFYLVALNGPGTLAIWTTEQWGA